VEKKGKLQEQKCAIEKNFKEEISLWIKVKIRKK
jgi:hypothetical protein